MQTVIRRKNIQSSTFWKGMSWKGMFWGTRLYLVVSEGCTEEIISDLRSKEVSRVNRSMKGREDGSGQREQYVSILLHRREQVVLRNWTLVKESVTGKEQGSVNQVQSGFELRHSVALKGDHTIKLAFF